MMLKEVRMIIFQQMFIGQVPGRISGRNKNAQSNSSKRV